MSMSNNGLSPNIPGRPHPTSNAVADTQSSNNVTVTPNSANAHPVPGGSQDSSPGAYFTPDSGATSSNGLGSPNIGGQNWHPAQGNDYAASASTGSQPWQNYSGTQDATVIPPNAAAQNASNNATKVKLDEDDIRAKARKIFSDGRVTLAELQQLRANKPSDDDGATRYREILNQELNTAARAGKISSATMQGLRNSAPDLFSGAHFGGPNINDNAMGTMQDFGFTTVQ